MIHGSCGDATPRTPERPAAGLRAPAARQGPARLRFLRDVLLGAACMVGLHLFVVQISVVRGSSMEPALHDGDRLVVDRVSCGMNLVQRGDIVVLRFPRDPAIDFVKRVVALPGDLVEMRDGVLLVNGRACEDYDCIQDRQRLEPLVVPDRHYFVLGDNRPISCDSRDFGLVAQELLEGRVRARFWPPGTASLF
ncbi:MAG: signal peptidase I [Planctomycetes bacterium]|nr:signal peptidase I [Planctomycetota bacterium]